MTDVHGEVAPGFEGVWDAFANNFIEHADVGAAFCAYHHGEKVVDLWGGLADAETREPWTADHLQLIFSSTKGAAAVCANLLAERGELDMDAPVIRYWPAFGAAGKEKISVRQLISHQAGLPWIPP